MKLFLFLIFMSQLCWSEEKTWSEKAPGGFSVTVAIPQTEITLIEKLHLQLTLTFPDTYNVSMDDLRSHLLYHTASAEAPFILANEETFPPNKTDHWITQKINFSLDPQYTGRHMLTFLGIEFKPNDPKTQSPVVLISPIFDVDVIQPVQAQKEKPLEAPLMTFSIDFPVDVDTENRRSALSISSQSRILSLFNQREIPWVGLLALAAALFFIFRFGKPPSQPEKEKAKQLASVKQQAAHELSQLQFLIKNKEIEPFYVGLTHIVRKFIENYYHIEADSRTTEEFLNEMAKHPTFTNETRDLLKSFLEKADKVKYAQAQATEQDCTQALETAIKLIQEKE